MVKLINNKEEFNNLSNEDNRLIVLKVFAQWCGWCKIMKPIFEELSEMKELKDYTFIEIDRDENRDWLLDYGFDIPTIPRFFAIDMKAKNSFDKKNILEELGGSQNIDEFKEKLIKIVNEHPEMANIKKTEKKEVTTKKNSNKKVAIIGSGPAGLTAAIYTSRASLDTTIYTGVQPGGQLTTTTEIENFPGAWDEKTKKGMMGPDLMALIQKQAESFGARIIMNEVSNINLNNNNTFDLELKNGSKENFDGVIVATGASAKYLGVEGEKKYVGKGYHSCATCDGFFYKGKSVIVVGGGDSAMEEAGFLSKFAEKVYLVHRSEEFKASKIMLERAKNNPKIEFILNKEIVEFKGEEAVQSVILQNTKDSSKEEFNIDGVFVAIGHKPNTDFVAQSLDRDSMNYLIPNSRKDKKDWSNKYSTCSNIPGIFIAGDVEDTVYRQAITAAGDGCKAAMDLEKWLED